MNEQEQGDKQEKLQQPDVSKVFPVDGVIPCPCCGGDYRTCDCHMTTASLTMWKCGTHKNALGWPKTFLD